MNVSSFGWVVISLTPLLFSVKRKYLFALAVLSAPLFNTSVLYVPALTFYLRTPFYLFVLLIARLLLDKAIEPSSGLKVYRRSENGWLALWLAAGLASLLACMHFSGRILVHSITGPPFPVWEPLSFSFFNITQLIYWVFWCCVFLAFSSEIISLSRIRQVIRCCVYSGLLILASGLTEQVLSLLGYSTLVTKMLVFLGAPDTRAPGYVLGNLPRMNSLVGEPGYTGLYLSFVLGMTIIPVLAKCDQWLWSRKVNVLLVIVLTMGVIFSAGTTGYLALLIVIVVGAALLFYQTKPQRFWSILFSWGFLAVVILGICSLVFLLFFKVSFFEFIRTTQLNVLLGIARSGPDRLQFAIDALALAAKHPLFGVGVGGNKAFALIPQMLSTIGLIGTGFFLMFNGVIMVRVLKKSFRRRTPPTIRAVGTGLVTAFVGTFGVMAVGESMGLLLPWYWLLVAVMAAFARIRFDANGSMPY